MRRLAAAIAIPTTLAVSSEARAAGVWTGKRFRVIKKGMNTARTNSKLLLAIIPMVG